MENGNLEMPCKIRKRRFPTTSSSSFANANLSQLFVDKTESPRNEKCVNTLDRSNCKEEESVNEVLDKSITNVDRSRNKSRSHTSPAHLSSPEVINSRYRHPYGSYGGMHLIYDAKLFEGKSQPCGEIEPETKDRKRSTRKPNDCLDEIKHSLTVSKQLLKLLTHVWTVDPTHDHHPTSMSLALTLNHELNKARAHVNNLIQDQRSKPTTSSEIKDQDKIRFAVKTIARELETERKLRRQTERMNKKLGRELATTKSSLATAVKKAESEKQAMEVLEKLCEKMAREIEEDRVELEELKKESERVREEMEEEREMMRVAEMLREERVYMKLMDAKCEYEDKHEQVKNLARDLEDLLEADTGIDCLKKTTKSLSWYQSTQINKQRDKTTLGNENRGTEGKVVNEKNALIEGARGLSWYENKEETVNDDLTNTHNEVAGRNSDCIEWEFGVEMRNETECLNTHSDERVLGFSCSSATKEYEDEMERYKMIKDLRDRIVSGSDLSRGTLDSESRI